MTTVIQVDTRCPHSVLVRWKGTFARRSGRKSLKMVTRQISERKIWRLRRACKPPE